MDIYSVSTSLIVYFLYSIPEEDLLMSIAAAEDTADITNSNSDSGRDSPRTTSSFSNT